MSENYTSSPLAECGWIRKTTSRVLREWPVTCAPRLDHDNVKLHLDIRIWLVRNDFKLVLSTSDKFGMTLKYVKQDGLAGPK